MMSYDELEAVKALAVGEDGGVPCWCGYSRRKGTGDRMSSFVHSGACLNVRRLWRDEEMRSLCQSEAIAMDAKIYGAQLAGWVEFESPEAKFEADRRDLLAVLASASLAMRGVVQHPFWTKYGRSVTEAEGVWRVVQLLETRVVTLRCV